MKRTPPKLNMSKRYKHIPWRNTTGYPYKGSPYGMFEVGGQKRGTARRDEIVEQIRTRGWITVNREGHPKTYHGQFGRDARKLIKLGVIKVVKTGRTQQLVLK